MSNKRARPCGEESKDELLQQHAVEAKLGKTKEKLSSGVFEIRFVEFVRLALVSGVDSSAKVFGRNNVVERMTDYELITGDRTDLKVRINGRDPLSFSSKIVHNNKKCNTFRFLMTHRFQGKQATPFTLEAACDVLCASASTEVLADLVMKFGALKPLPPGTIGLFVYSKSIICNKPKTVHTITAAGVTAVSF